MAHEHIGSLKRIAQQGGWDFTDYSGRGMYGKYCAAIITNDPDTTIEYALEMHIHGACTDTLGKGYIVYWPGIPYEEE